MSNPLIRKIAGRGDRVLRPSAFGKILPRKTISQRPHRAKIFTAFLFPRYPLPLLPALSLRVRPFNDHAPSLCCRPFVRPSAFAFAAAACHIALCVASGRGRKLARHSPSSHRRARPARFYAPAYGVFTDRQVHFPARLAEKRRTGAQKKAALSPVSQG